MKTDTLLLIGGGGLALLWLMNSQSTTTTAAGTTTAASSILNSLLPASTPVSTIPAPPAVFDMTYYLTYQYPVMKTQNPNILNPNYILTDAEAQQYLNNYLDLRQGLPTWATVKTPWNLDGGNSVLDKARYHWALYGVPNQRTFLPLTPSDMQAYVPAPVVAKASSGGGVFSDILGAVKVAAPIVAAIAGTPNGGYNSAEIEVIATGSALALDILPMYYQAQPTAAMMADDTITNTLNQYL